MAALFEINNELMKLYESAIDENGEIEESALEALESLELERSEKIENIACLIKNLRSDAEQIKVEADKLAKRAKAAQNRADSLKEYLLANIPVGVKFKSPRMAISWGSTSAVEVYDQSQIPEKYTTIETVVKVDKNELKRDLKDGDIPGCLLVNRPYITIK